MANGRVIACFFTSLWILAPFSPASAWDSPATAVPIAVGETTAAAVVNNLEEKQYRRFTLSAPGFVVVDFTHDVPADPSSAAGWKISLLKLVEGAEQNSFSTTSFLADRGVTCSTRLEANTPYYLLVQGAIKAADQTAAPLNLPYRLKLSRQDQDMTLVRLEQELVEKDTLHQTIMGAYGAVPSNSRNLIKCRQSTFVENLLFNKQSTVLIDGGKDSCFDRITGHTTIKGELLVRLGTLYVKGLKLRP